MSVRLIACCLATIVIGAAVYQLVGWVGIGGDGQLAAAAGAWLVAVLVALMVAPPPPALPDDRCARCDYSLQGNTKGACPECGYTLGMPADVPLLLAMRRRMAGLLSMHLQRPAGDWRPMASALACGYAAACVVALLSPLRCGWLVALLVLGPAGAIVHLPLIRMALGDRRPGQPLLWAMPPAAATVTWLLSLVAAGRGWLLVPSAGVLLVTLAVVAIVPVPDAEELGGRAGRMQRATEGLIDWLAALLKWACVTVAIVFVMLATTCRMLE